MAKPPKIKVVKNLGRIENELTDGSLVEVIPRLQNYIDTHPGETLSLEVSYDMDYQYPFGIVTLLSFRDETDEEYVARMELWKKMDRNDKKKKKEDKKAADLEAIRKLRKLYPEEFTRVD